MGVFILSKESKNSYGLGVILGIITAIATVAATTVAIFMFLDRKKKKEDRELEEYLETSIQ